MCVDAWLVIIMPYLGFFINKFAGFVTVEVLASGLITPHFCTVSSQFLIFNW